MVYCFNERERERNRERKEQARKRGVIEKAIYWENVKYCRYMRIL